MAEDDEKLVCMTKKELAAIQKKAYEEGYSDADAGRRSRYDNLK